MPQETSTGPMKPADLARLELAFASDPQSKAFVDLANAYMELNRIVEAMVVAKKGMKSHPVEGHFILAKIYNRQQKSAKAIDELGHVLTADPVNLQALMFKGNLHFRVGEDATGIELFKKAFELAPDNVEVKATLMEKGVEIAPKKVPPPAPEEDEEDAGAAARAPVSKPARPPSKAIRPKRPVTRPRPAVTPEEAGISAEGEAVPKSRPRPAAPGPVEDFSETPAWMRKQAARRTMILVVILATVSLSIIAGISIYAARERKVGKLVKEATASIRSDTYAGYKKARELNNEALGVKSDEGPILATGAYVDAVLFGEFGEGEAVAKEGHDYVDRAIKAKEQSPTLAAAQALLRFYSGDARGAESMAQDALQKGQNSKLFLVAGIIQAAAGNYEMAIESYKRGRNLETMADIKITDPRSLMLMADLSVRQGNAKQALAQYDFILKGQSDHIGAILGRAQLYADMDDRRREAEREVQKVLGMPQGQVSKKELAKAYFILSLLYLAEGKESEAERNLNTARDLDPQNAQFHFQLGRRYFASREFAKAKQAFEKAIKLDSKKPEYYREFAEMQNIAGDHDGAIANVTSAMRYLADSNKGPFYLIRARALRLKKDYKETQKEIAKASSLNSEDPFAHLEQALLYRDQEKMDMCVAEFENSITGFVAIRNVRKTSEAAVQLAKLYMDRNEFEPAEELLQKTVERDKAYPDVYFYLGKFYKASKVAKEQAREMFQNYLKLAPNGEFAKQAKQEL
ncbi:MAG: tetratricopeptide repeat protein [Deltaproteobacteria bacterium]|nr:tetratricopeptide repeat protein [Deltaproteobacteria bacterium]